MSYTNDPFEAAREAAERPTAYFGKMDVTAAFVKLVKGVGKQPWVDGADDIQERRTLLTLVLNPIEAAGVTFLVQRELIAESREFSAIIWPSLKALSLKGMRDLHGKYARVEMVKTGETYTSKRGETQERTTMKFTALYDTADEATAAYYAERGQSADDASAVDMSHGAGTPATNVSVNGNGNAERDTALQFLTALVKNAGGDKGKLAGMIAQMPLIAKYFTADSPEVVSLMAGVKA